MLVMSYSRIVPVLATFAMLSSGAVSTVGCAAKVTAEPVKAPEVAVVEATPAPPVVVAPPPKLAATCDSQIATWGHLKFPNEVEFDEGKATIKSTPTTNAILQCLVDFMNNNQMVTKFSIEGHTDNKGDAAMNQTLSDQRAQAIVTFLTGRGVSASRLMGKGFGATKPVAPNDTPANMAKNRRVEFHIIELNGAKATKEALALAENPPAVAVVSVSSAPATGTTTVVGPAVGVSVTAPAAAGGVAVTVPSGGATMMGPSVSVGVGVSAGASAGGAAGAPGKGAPAKKDDKKDEKKK